MQFKILTGGVRTDTKLIGGIVCSKNVAHKRMSMDIDNPKILLLLCSIVYQRTEGRLMSLEPVLMQVIRISICVSFILAFLSIGT